MTETPNPSPATLRDRFAQPHAETRPLTHQLTTAELAHALLALRTANQDHASLATEAAHRLLVLENSATGLATEADRLRHHQRLANARIDDMRNGMVSMQGRIDDMRRAADALALQPAIPVDYRGARLRADLARRITEAIGQASMCWDNPAGAGVFDSRQATRIANELCATVALEIDAARLRHRAGDDLVDWRRRALEAEQRADSMQCGILHAQLDRLEQAEEERDREAFRQAHANLRVAIVDLPGPRQIFQSIKTRLATWRKKDRP